MSKASQEEKAGYATREHALYGMFDRGERDRKFVLDSLAAIIDGTFGNDAEPEVHRVTPGVTRTLQEWKETLGQDYWNPDINEANFALEPVDGEVELRLHHFNEAISDAKATRRLDELGLVREDRLSVILAFLEDYPGLQREFPIVTNAAWTDPGGYRNVVYAHGGSQCRSLRLDWGGLGWSAYCRFLVRRK